MATRGERVFGRSTSQGHRQAEKASLARARLCLQEKALSPVSNCLNDEKEPKPTLETPEKRGTIADRISTRLPLNSEGALFHPSRRLMQYTTIFRRLVCMAERSAGSFAELSQTQVVHDLLDQWRRIPIARIGGSIQQQPAAGRCDERADQIGWVEPRLKPVRLALHDYAD